MYYYVLRIIYRFFIITFLKNIHLFCVVSRNCLNNDFHCNKTGRCIPSTWICDKDDDCGDGSDENEEKCKMFNNYTTCHSNQFECVNKKCIFEVINKFKLYFYVFEI